tara:strand:- start:403 stop:576 length:174 start_codon:yes stop_codon:yes gene_type:complete
MSELKVSISMSALDLKAALSDLDKTRDTAKTETELDKEADRIAENLTHCIDVEIEEE